MTGDGLSVKDFGAVGDGVADDTAAFNAAIVAASAPNGSLGNPKWPVIVPRGDYMVSSQIVIPDRIMLHGESRATSRIFALPGFPPDTAVAQIGSSLTDYDQANGLRGIAIECKQNADIGVSIFNCNENGGLYDFDIANWLKSGIVVNGPRALNFSIENGAVGTSYASVPNPIGIDLQSFNSPLCIRRVSVGPAAPGGLAAPNGIGIRYVCGGVSSLRIVDCHFEKAQYGIQGSDGKLIVENCDGDHTLTALLNVIGGTIAGWAQALIVDSINGAVAILDGTTAFAAAPLAVGTYGFMKRYAWNRQKGLGAIQTISLTGTTNASGIVVIPHHMPARPGTVVFSLNGPNNSTLYQAKLLASDATGLTFRVWSVAVGAVVVVPNANFTFNISMEM